MSKITLGGVILAIALFISIGAGASSTVVVHPSDLSIAGWFFYNDETNIIDNTLGSFVPGPSVAPAGYDSVQISVSGTQRRNLATYQFGGTPLSDITDLKYSTYNPLAGNGAGAGSQRSGYLQFNVDFNGSDTWQRRLVFLPSDNGTVVQDSWQEWNAINGGNALWRYSGPVWPGTLTSGTVARTWNDIVSSYPGIRIRISDPFLGIRVGEPYANGYTENIDKLVFGTAAGLTIFDFENDFVLSDKNQCKKGGWMSSTLPVFKNQGDCVSFFASN